MSNDKTSKSMRPDDERPKLALVDSLIGTVFAEKYEILSLLGEGGMSKVYKARHKFMKRIVAVKLLHEDVTSDTTAKARFQQEAEAASALNHQNVVTVFDFGFTPSGQAFFVMDCLEGKSLAEILEETGSLPIAEALEIFTQGCDGLDHAHRKGIIHRDIKPSNLVIIKQEDGSDLVKLVDFGIAKLMAPPSGEKQQQLTLAGEVFGTPAYMSPEQCNGSPLDARSDIYSFGCLMYEGLSGQPPLLGDTMIATITKQITERPRPLSETGRTNIPAHVDAVIMKCLEKDPASRYASALELKQALLDAAYASGVKGLRVGAVAEPRAAGAQGFSSSQGVSLAEKKVTQKWRMHFGATLIAMAVIVGGGAAYIFLYQGPEGDKGSIFSKIRWQIKQSSADRAIKEGQYDKAIEDLKSATRLAEEFGDGHSRLESTLNKLGEVYGLAHMYVEQEAINSKLTDLSNEKVSEEFDDLMKLLSDWEQTTTSSAIKEQRALQAAAFADRIVICAEKLLIRSKKKEEELLKKAIKVFDSMEVSDWKTRVRLRIGLAECYRQQQRADEEKSVLLEAVKLTPETPSDEDGWRAKVQAQLLLGQFERNLSSNTVEADQAAARLEKVLGWVKAHLSHDKDLLRDSLNSLAIAERFYNDKAHGEKAAAYEQESRALGN